MPEEPEPLRINIILPEEYEAIAALAPEEVDVRKRDKLKKWIEKSFKNLDSLKLNLGTDLNTEELFGLDRPEDCRPDKLLLCIYSSDKVKLSSFSAVLGSIAFKPPSGRNQDGEQDIHEISGGNNYIKPETADSISSYTYSECVRLQKILEKSKNGLRKAFSATMNTISGKVFKQIRASEFDMLSYYRPYLIDRQASSRPFLKPVEYPNRSRGYSEHRDVHFRATHNELKMEMDPIPENISKFSKEDDFEGKHEPYLLKSMVEINPLRFRENSFFRKMCTFPRAININNRNTIYSYNQVDYYGQENDDNYCWNAVLNDTSKKRVKQCPHHRPTGRHADYSSRNPTHKYVKCKRKKNSITCEASFLETCNSDDKLRRKQEIIEEIIRPKNIKYKIDENRSVSNDSISHKSDVAVEVLWGDPELEDKKDAFNSGYLNFNGTENSCDRIAERQRTLPEVSGPYESRDSDNGRSLKRRSNLEDKCSVSVQADRDDFTVYPECDNRAEGLFGLDCLKNIFDRHRCLFDRAREKQRCFDDFARTGDFHFEENITGGKSCLKYTKKKTACAYTEDKRSIFQKMFTKTKSKREPKRYRKFYVEEESDMDGKEPEIIKLKLEEGFRKSVRRQCEIPFRSPTHPAKELTCNNCGCSIFKNSLWHPPTKTRKKSNKTDSLDFHRSSGKTRHNKCEVEQVIVKDESKILSLKEEATVENCNRLKYKEADGPSSLKHGSFQYDVRRESSSGSFRLLKDLQHKRQKISEYYFVYHSDSPRKERASTDLITSNSCKSRSDEECDVSTRCLSNRTGESNRKPYLTPIDRDKGRYYGSWHSDRKHYRCEDGDSTAFIERIEDYRGGIRNSTRSILPNGALQNYRRVSNVLTPARALPSDIRTDRGSDIINTVRLETTTYLPTSVRSDSIESNFKEATEKLSHRPADQKRYLNSLNNKSSDVPWPLKYKNIFSSMYSHDLDVRCNRFKDTEAIKTILLLSKLHCNRFKNTEAIKTMLLLSKLNCNKAALNGLGHSKLNSEICENIFKKLNKNAINGLELVDTVPFLSRDRAKVSLIEKDLEPIRQNKKERSDYEMKFTTDENYGRLPVGRPDKKYLGMIATITKEKVATLIQALTFKHRSEKKNRTITDIGKENVLRRNHLNDVDSS